MSGGPQDFLKLLTPEEAYEMHKDLAPPRDLAHFQRLAKKRVRCEVCGQPAWRMVDTGLCFSCTTGESDASEDYELIQL